MRQYKVLDLFAGGGGFSQGFLMAKHPDANFKIVKAVEINEDACETLKKHLGPDHVLCGDVTKAEIKERLIQECKAEHVDVIIGGPPCQTYSLVGPARSGTMEMREALKDDSRNTLYKHFLEIVGEVKPHFVVFENV
ncbi:MAG: DNA cytosine methyltransferase, partial [Tumebacillaceae bacterium]